MPTLRIDPPSTGAEHATSIRLCAMQCTTVLTTFTGRACIGGERRLGIRRTESVYSTSTPTGGCTPTARTRIECTTRRRTRSTTTAVDTIGIASIAGTATTTMPTTTRRGITGGIELSEEPTIAASRRGSCR